MGLVIATTIFIAGIFCAALSQQLTDEFKAWTPWLVEKFIRLAVRRLPPEHRERLGEEWRSHTLEVPGQIGKLIVAIGFIVASNEIAQNASNRRTIGPVLYAFGVAVFIEADAMINYQSFANLSWTTPFITVGSTILIGVQLGFAAHYHGLVYKQYEHFFESKEFRSRRRDAIRMLLLGGMGMTTSLAFVYYATSASLNGLAAAVIGGGTHGLIAPLPSYFWIVGGAILGNVLVYLVMVLWSYMHHAANPNGTQPSEANDGQ